MDNFDFGIIHEKWKKYLKSNFNKETDIYADNFTLSEGNVTMKFYIEKVKQKPENGYPVIIGFHGGGGCADETNNQQWENHKQLYKNELHFPYIWIAPRTNLNTWNLWHVKEIDALLIKLLHLLYLRDEINHNKIYLTGYSAGGDGVYKLLPRLCDLFAGGCSMAGHPNGADFRNLLNCPTTVCVGENDSQYNRNGMCLKYKDYFCKLKDSTKGFGFENRCQIVKGKGHWMNKEDSKMINWVLNYERNLYPEQIIFKPCSDNLNNKNYFYYFYFDNKTLKNKHFLISNLNKEDNSIIITTNINVFYIFLNKELIDYNRKFKIMLNGKLFYDDNVAIDPDIIDESIEIFKDKNKIYYSKIKIEFNLDYIINNI